MKAEKICKILGSEDHCVGECCFLGNRTDSMSRVVVMLIQNHILTVEFYLEKVLFGWKYHRIGAENGYKYFEGKSRKDIFRTRV